MTVPADMPTYGMPPGPRTPGTRNMSCKLYSTIPTISSIGIPQLGFGVYQSRGQKCVDAVTGALRAGYRHIDTAQYYENEKEVGFAVKEFIKVSDIKRQDVFITTKILTPEGSVESSYAKCMESIKALDYGKDPYVDLFLIHSPNVGSDSRKESWNALTLLYKEGKARMIGVSNFGIGHIDELKTFGVEWPPHVNQIEQRAIVEYCGIWGIHVEAYCPLVRNQRSDEPILTLIAEHHKKSVAQVLVRYALQKNWIPLPKSETPWRIAKNCDVFEFHLSDYEMQKINSLDEGEKGALVQAVTNELPQQ